MPDAAAAAGANGQAAPAAGAAAAASSGQPAGGNGAQVAQPAAASASAAPAPAPAAVEYKFDPVDGLDPEFDTQIVADAKLLGLDQAKAKAFRDLEISRAKDAAAADAKAATDAKAKADQAKAQMVADWDAKNRAHTEFGGPKFDETTTRIEKVIAEFDKDGEFAAELARAPEMKNHPAFRSFLARIAYAHGEASFVQGGAAQGGTVQRAATLAEMYPSMK